MAATYGLKDVGKALRVALDHAMMDADDIAEPVRLAAQVAEAMQALDEGVDFDFLGPAKS